MSFSEKQIAMKYINVTAIISIICATMVEEIIIYRTPWSITGSIGGIIQIISAMAIPLIAMRVGQNFINDERDFKEYYKDIFIKFIIPFGVYYVLLKVLSLGQYKVVESIGSILGIFVLAPFIKVLLNNLNQRKLNYLVILIFIGSILNVYFKMFGISITIDLSVFSSWVVFCIIGYALPKVESKKTTKLIYILGVLSAISTFMVRAVPIQMKLWEVSPTLILYCSAIFLFLNNFNWTIIHRFKVIRKSIECIDKYKVGIFFLHNFIIYNVLYSKFNISANRFKVVFGSAIVLVVTLILGCLISALVDKIIAKNQERLIRWSSVIIRRLTDINSYKHYLIWIFSALVITFISEALLREGMEFAVDFVHFVDHKKFIANFLLVLAVTSPALLFKRTYLILGLISEGLIGISMASALMYRFRGTPLTYSDFFSIQDGLAVAGEYLSVNIIIFVIALIGIILFINIKLSIIKVKKKGRFNYKNIVIVSFILLVAKVNLNYVLDEGILGAVGWDIKYSYNENGFFFSIYDSYLGYKREKPPLYNAENIEAIKENIILQGNNEFLLSDSGSNGELTSNDEENPNIIVLQLESIMDPLTIEGVELTGDPLKNMREIFNDSTGGKLFVPAYGGGTAKTEFEILTGMSLDYLSPGEIPHNTYLKKDCIESIAYVLDSEIYEKTLIHNYQGSFYERNKAYEHLGFERYIPMEYMYNRQFWDVEFPEDQLILDNIKAAIEDTEKNDFIFAIAAQTHGSYDEEYKNENSDITVSGTLEEGYINQLQDYVDDLVMVDKMVKELTEFVDNLEEPTILAVYSDHLPSYDPINIQYSREQKYTSHYFIYDNMGLEKKKQDIEAYELTTKIFDIIGLPGGVMNQFHRNYKDDEDYQEKMEYVQYDILDGERYIYNKTNPYKKTNFKMGIKEITIDKVDILNGSIEVEGSNFNEYSCIYIDGKAIPTEYVSENKLIGEVTSNKISKVKVHQLTRRDKSIGATKEFKVEN